MKLRILVMTRLLPLYHTFLKKSIVFMVFVTFQSLFPAEKLNGEEINEENPERNKGELGKEGGKAGVFGHNEANAVYDGGDGDGLADGLEPFGEEEGGEKGAGKEHHGHGDEI